jgi:hypothetical protein
MSAGSTVVETPRLSTQQPTPKNKTQSHETMETKLPCALDNFKTISTTEPSDAGGPKRPHWQLTSPTPRSLE